MEIPRSSRRRNLRLTYSKVPYFVGGFVPITNLISASCIIMLLLGVPAEANLIITPTFASNITSDPNAAIIESTIISAIAVYENSFADPITAHITFQEMSSGLGLNNTSFLTIPYATYLTSLTADAKTSDDATAIAHLPTATQYSTFFGTSNINVKTANARAIGISVSQNPDGVISLNTSITNPGRPGSSGQFSLMAVTEHEIDEVLGLFSALNTAITEPFPEDLFRYDSSGARGFTNNTSATAFFSINGTTDLAEFNNQRTDGDFGDWRSDPLPPGVQPRVQDAFATPGANPALSVELRALDVTGYDLITPEPGTGVLLAGALVVLAGLKYTRVSRKARP
jgi:hypothetical protein